MAIATTGWLAINRNKEDLIKKGLRPRKPITQLVAGNKEDLIKKGLRHSSSRKHSLFFGNKEDLIKKGLRHA